MSMPGSCLETEQDQLFAPSYQVLYSYWFSKDQGFRAPLRPCGTSKASCLVITSFSAKPKSYAECSPPLTWYGMRCSGCRAVRKMAAPWRNLVERVHITYEMCKSARAVLHLRTWSMKDRCGHSTGPCTLRQPRALWLINLVGTHT